MKKTILLIGGSSDLGRSFKKYSKFKDEYEFLSTNSKILNLKDDNSVEKFIEKNKVNNFRHIVFLSASNNIKNFVKLNKKEIDNTFKINFQNFMYLLSELLKEKNKIESIIIISSLYGKFGRQGRSLYTSSKHLLNGLVKNLCIDLSGQEIKVNSITPGFINTKMTKKNLSKKEIISISTKTPTGRLGTPKEVSNVIDFLISKESSFINGQDIVVDGGYTSGGFFD